ncbi:MAG TPA: YqiJ family protein [Allosphingosinicella sp.]|jgi:membrane protein implicated in regulation of membrane protease activity|nr:YqiJ family protein [Allosphingosinicella sp.]
MLEIIAAPANLPFSVALLVMLMIGVVEALGLGASAIHLDSDVGLDGHGGDLLGWLGFGQVPLLMLLVVFLAVFGLVGLAVQQFAGPLPLWIAAPAAAAAALPLTGIGARGLARIMPGDETTAVSLDSLVGRRGTITVGTARRGSPAQARVADIHGQPHYVMVEPYDDDQAIGEGETVRLDRRDGNIFIAVGRSDRIPSGLDALAATGLPSSTRRD